MNKKKAFAVGGAAAVSLLMAMPAFAAVTSDTSATASTTSSYIGKHAHASHHSKHAHAKLTNATFGTVASIDGSTFTLTHKSKTATTTVSILTNSATVFKVNGKANTSTTLTVGQRVVVMGTKDSSGNITDATSVNIMVRHAARSAPATSAS